MTALLEAHEQRARARSEEPHIYQSGDSWRYSWAGEDRGSFDTEQDARSAALRFKRQSLLHLATASLDRH